MSHNSNNNWLNYQNQPQNGTKMDIFSKIARRMAELAILYWIPWSVGNTGQKGSKTDAYVAQHNQK